MVAEEKIIRAGQCRPVAWKNGGGTTRELAVFPAGAGPDNFDWRISIAQVSASGSFSAFDGIDRVLAVIAGRLHLRGPGIDIVLDASSPPFAFDGALAVTGDPLETVVFALNAMAKSDAYAIEMERLTSGDTIAISGTTCFVALEAQGLGNSHLDAFDGALIEQTVMAQGNGLRIAFPRSGRQHSVRLRLLSDDDL